MIARVAAAAAQANAAIRSLIILAYVISADETAIRVGPGPTTRKRYRDRVALPSKTATIGSM